MPKGKPAAIGIDVGSTTWKGVVVDSSGKILAERIESSDPLIEPQTERLVAELKTETGCDGEIPIAATGYGRKRVKADRVITEITCHAKGAFYLAKKPGVLIDIGGQDTKVIRLGEKGEVLDFHMNDKCAAGSGRFLEVILDRLKVPLDQTASYVKKSKKAVPISNMCTVFAESEVISLVAQGEDLNDILAGLHQALAARVASMAGTLPDGIKIFMSGGVAQNQAMVAALDKTLAAKVEVLPHPQLVGALGAALAVAG